MILPFHDSAEVTGGMLVKNKDGTVNDARTRSLLKSIKGTPPPQVAEYLKSSGKKNSK